MNGTTRLPELDALRGLAVLLMVLYHAAFDFRFFYGWPLDVFHGGWWLLARTSAILFLLIAGICFALSWERTPPHYHFQKTAKRFLVLALAAALVSATTWLIAPQDFIKFGILHLFALSTLLLPLFAPLKYWNALLGLLVLFIPTVPTLPTLLTVPTIPTLPTILTVLLGSPPPHFSSLDYFPLIPWFGVLLLGFALGHTPYFRHSLLHSRVIGPSPVSSPNGRGSFRQVSAAWRSVGRHSLAIYLLHQPLLIAMLSLTLGLPHHP